MQKQVITVKMPEQNMNLCTSCYKYALENEPDVEEWKVVRTWHSGSCNECQPPRQD